MQKTDSPIFQIKITLKQTVPPVWRRLLVQGNANLGMLHAIIQIVMGWTNSHLHHFYIDGKRYVDPVLDQDMDLPDGEEEAIDENEWALLDVLRPDISQFDYEYDFGDSWRHQITIERMEIDCAGFQGYALCLAGERGEHPTIEQLGKILTARDGYRE